MDIKPLQIGSGAPKGIQNNSALLGYGVKHFCLVGGTMSGKTFGLCKVLSQMPHPPVGGIWLSAKIDEQDSFDCLRDWAESKGYPFNYVGTHIDGDTFQEVMADDTPTWTIIDDFDVKDPKSWLIDSLFQRSRHMHNYCFLTTQTFSQLSQVVRTNTAVFCVWPCGSRSLAAAALRGISTGLDPRRQLLPAYDFICRPENNHSFLMLIRNGLQAIVTGDPTPRLLDISRDLAEVRIRPMKLIEGDSPPSTPYSSDNE